MGVSKKIKAPRWNLFQTRTVASVRNCCLLLMGIDEQFAKHAGLVEYPTTSKRGKTYNNLLKETYFAMLGGEPLLKPVKNEVTEARVDFQKLQHDRVLSFSQVVSGGRSQVLTRFG
jgi:hypothetical protein